MQWAPGARPQEDRSRPYRGVLEAIQDRVAPSVNRYGDNMIPGAGQLLNSIVRTGSEMVPGLGDVVAVEDLQGAASNNDWGGIGLGLLAAIPGIPAIRGARGEVRAARRAGGLLEPSRPGLLGDTAPSYRVERSQDLAPTDTPESLKAQGYEIDPATNTWARTVATEAPSVDYPIRAYHGSPHSFDRFSLDKIGTGEGAQAYGHGLYFAESEDVARSYRDTLAGDGYLRADGSVWNPQTLQHMNVRVAANQNGADLEATIARAREVLQRAIESSPPETVAMARADLADLESLRDAGGVTRNPGSMYEVGINAHPDTFLDWDAPISSQSPLVQQSYGRFAEQYPDVVRDLGPNEPIGQDFLRAYSEAVPHNPADPSDYRRQMTSDLREQGIPGIRYLDGNSRGAGEGSSNYVVFNDELVKILRKYGISGLGLSGGAALGGGLLTEQQQAPAPTSF